MGGIKTNILPELSRLAMDGGWRMGQRPILIREIPMRIHFQRISRLFLGNLFLREVYLKSQFESDESTLVFPRVTLGGISERFGHEMSEWDNGHEMTMDQNRW